MKHEVKKKDIAAVHAQYLLRVVVTRIAKLQLQGNCSRLRTWFGVG